jgi:crotonobetainyl-CoA:carnitine CoA-transferase CaiB-like acyl-CoA transferase
MLMALNIREQTGMGQYIDLSSSEVLNMMVGDEMMDYAMNGRSPRRDGNHDAIMAPHSCYRCKGEDSWVSIAVATEEEWAGLCKAMGNPEWCADPAFATRVGRWESQARLDPLIEAWTSQHTNVDLMKRLQGLGVAAMPTFKAEDLFANEHLVERGGIAEITHPVLGTRQTIMPPWKLSATPAGVERRPPLLGEHNQYVLRELLGISQQELDDLMEAKVVY